MNWITLYLIGKGRFAEDVQKKLDSSGLDFMPGYIESPVGKGNYQMIWIPEGMSVREIKKAVGSKLVWKHRLRFYTELDDFLQAVSPPSRPASIDEEPFFLDSLQLRR